MTKPPDALAVTRPAWALALHHVTLGVDDVRISPWSEVADETLAVLIPWLALACANDEPVPLPAGLEHHTAVGIPHGSGLVMTVYGSILSENPPLVTFGVAQIADNGDDIWRRLTQWFDVARDLQKPPEPWCGVVVHPALALDSAVMKWIGDFERHVAWAWITNASNIKAAIHGVVSLKHGSPARRTGARCLREKSIDQRTGTTGR